MTGISPRKRIWGWFFFDWASQPYHTLLITFVFGPYFASVASDHFMTTGLSEGAADARAQTMWSWGLTVTGLIIGLGAPIIGAFATGAARSAMEYAIDYAKKRRTFGASISGYQAIQFKLAEMYQKVETSRLLTWKGAWEADQGMDPTVTASVAKFYASEAALEVVNDALQIFAGYGYTKMFPIEKLLRDVRLLRIYEGTSEIQRMIVAGHLLNGYQAAMPALEDLPLHREKDPEDLDEGTGVWRCRMCGYVHYGDEPPEECPYCFFPKSTFKKNVP